MSTEAAWEARDKEIEEFLQNPPASLEEALREVPDNLEEIIREAAKRPMTPEEIHEQRISMVMSVLGDQLTRRQVREMLRPIYGW